MATRFIEQATQQLNPLFAEQESAIQAQIPAIQQLYDTLATGLRSESGQALETGVRDITEDASRRGVLRSTIPVDARANLQTALSQALTQSLGELNVRRAGDVAGVNTSLNDLRLKRASSIFDLANTLQAQDLKEREFAMQTQLAREKNAAKASPDPVQVVSAVSNNLRKVAGADGYVSPQSFHEARQAWVALGGKASDFYDTFRSFVNPAHWWDYKT